MMTSLAGGLAMFFAAIPKVIAFAVILIVGWFIANLIAGLAGFSSRDYFQAEEISRHAPEVKM